MDQPKKLNYDKAIDIVKSNTAKKKLQIGYNPSNNTQLLTHGKKQAKAVIMMHGITANPSQYDYLAQDFFKAGYNVFIPLAPHHGTPEKTDHSRITRIDLQNYMRHSLAIGTALGDEVGIIGMSGGATLATHMSKINPHISRLLVLSPFYEPSENELAKWKLPIFKTIYGYNIAPDKYTHNFSLRTLSKYLMVADSYKKDHVIENLDHVAVATSARDQFIDLDLSHKLPSYIAASSHATFSPHRLNKNLLIGHDIIDGDNKAVQINRSYLNKLYKSLYENKDLPDL